MNKNSNRFLRFNQFSRQKISIRVEYQNKQVLMIDLGEYDQFTTLSRSLIQISRMELALLSLFLLKISIFLLS